MIASLIEIVPYNPNWPSIYMRIVKQLRQLVPQGSQLHHIGSTAVPNLSAKDVIDIQLTVADLHDVEIGKIEAAGFKFVAERQDHQPAGQTIAKEELHKLYFRSRDPAVHLHVREQNRFNQRYAILCRDYLRAHPDAAAAYGTIKAKLADRFASDNGSYCAIKDPVFDLIMAGAEIWAKTSGWRLPAGD